MEAYTIDTSGSVNQTVEIEVDWTYTEEGFFCHAEQALSWKHQGHQRRGRPRRSWRKVIEEEAEIVGKIWKQVKAIYEKKVH